MDQNTFFSDKNKDLIYTICRDEIIKQTQYNIDTNRKYFKTFGEIMKIIHKHAGNKNDLTELNNKTIAKTIPYISEQINKKKIKEKPELPSNNILNAPVIIEENIGSNNDSNTGNNLPVAYRGETTSLNKSLEDNYNSFLNSRRENKEIPQQIDLTLKNSQNFDEPNVLLDKIIKERESFLNVDLQHNPNSKQPLDTIQSTESSILENDKDPIIQKTLLQQKDEEPKLNFESYDLNNNLLGDLYGDADLNTFKLDNEKVDAMKLFEQQMSERTKSDNDYRKIQQEKIKFEEQQKNNNKIVDLMKDQHDIKKQEEEKLFQQSLSEQMNTKMNNIDVENLKSQIDRRVVQSLDDKIQPPTADDLEIAQSNRLKIEDTEFEKMKNSIFANKKYINRENLLIVNSGDRDWFNENEDRYSFQVRFKPSVGENGEKGLGVDTIYKNIVSFEMIRVLMAIENIIIPFDNRIFIDYKSLPYIALKIDELQPLYSGTNSRINNTFAKLLFDKDHTNEVIVNPTISSSPYEKKFSRQFSRGYSSMAPMSNEKKTFYPSPLSSLNRLTISLLTPYGENIKNHTDVLTIKTLTFERPVSGVEIDVSKGFPIDKTVDKYIKVKTIQKFSNRVFKIGDNVKFKKFVCVDLKKGSESELESFINREQGHYIINLQKEESIISTSPTFSNEGYISIFYISPPGDINYSGSAIDFIQNDNTFVPLSSPTDSLVDSDMCKVINQSIQTHYVFKVVTREEDVSQVISPLNI